MYKNEEDRIKYAHEYYLKHKNETIRRTRQYYLDHKEYLDEMNKINKHNKGIKFMNEIKECSMFLGCYVAENILSLEFKNIIRMKVTNPGYDYVCGKGYFIDVKSSCLSKDKWGSEKWKFHIERNKIADFFLLIGFDNRNDLNPMHIWLVPGHIINSRIGIGISNNVNSLNKYKIYERSLDNAILCCNEMKQK